MKNKERQALQNRLSKLKVRSSNWERYSTWWQNVGSNYNKHIEDASFFKAYNKKKAELDKSFDWELVQEEIDNAISKQWDISSCPLQLSSLIVFFLHCEKELLKVAL
jgi:hypothetical protein